LNVNGKYDSGDNAWLMNHGAVGEWAIAFHGIRGEFIPLKLINIIKYGFIHGPN
jgi:hypothetical protein